MSIPTTRRSAKALVEKISNDHGYLSEAVLATITPDTRRLVEEALLKKDLMIGSSVITYEIHPIAVTRSKCLTA
jgi:hypothetical protein